MKARILILMMLMAALTGCYNHSINGDLDGQWRVLEIRELATDQTVEPERIFYNFFLHTVNLTYYNMPELPYSGNVQYDGKRLSLSFPGVKVATLKRWGMDSKQTDFEIVTLTSKSLILKSGYAEIRLKKF